MRIGVSPQTLRSEAENESDAERVAREESLEARYLMLDDMDCCVG
jgi:hypothetical protein